MGTLGMATIGHARDYLQERLWLPQTESHMRDDERRAIFDAQQILAACYCLAAWEAYGNRLIVKKPGYAELIFS